MNALFSFKGTVPHASPSRSRALGAAWMIGSILMSAAISSCSTPTTINQRSFNRPFQLSFLCFDNASGEAVDFANCSLDPDKTRRDGFSMHGVLLQSTRGEVALVDLDNRRVVDSDRRVPGFTFVSAGDAPAGMAVPRTNPQCLFVANRGSSNLTTLETKQLRGKSPNLVRAPLPLSSRPSAIALSEDETQLFVALDEEAAIVQYQVANGCDLTETSRITLPVVGGTAVNAAAPDDVLKVCPTSAATASSNVAAIRDVSKFTGTPNPLELLVDGTTLLVADERLPVIHRIETTTGQMLTPLLVGAPIRGLTLSPEVPGEDGTTMVRYLYAIDAVDGSVLVVDYTPSRSTFGQVLTVAGLAQRFADRLSLPVPARTAKVVTLNYPGRMCVPGVTQDNEASPSNLRGVFLAVGLIDGTLRLFDIYDLDAPCRAGNAQCLNPISSNDVFASIRRHQPRQSTYNKNPIALTSGPSFVVAGAQLGVGVEGTTSSSGLAPRLNNVDCASLGLENLVYSRLYPDTRMPLICGVTDAKVVAAELWNAGWEGVIPGTSLGSPITISGSEATVDAAVDLCALGVLGSENVPAGNEPESRSQGDMLSIIPNFDAATMERSLCRAVARANSPTDTQDPILVPIRTVSFDEASQSSRVVFDANAPLLLTLPFEGRTLTLADALSCLPGPVRFEIRTRNSYTVGGYNSAALAPGQNIPQVTSLSGFYHRVRAGASGACEVDTSISPLRNGRAFDGVLYQNPRVAFLISGTPNVENFLAQAPELRFVIGNVSSNFLVNLGNYNSFQTTVLTLPADIGFDPFSQKMYVVETERRGLIEIPSLPFQFLPSISYE